MSEKKPGRPQSGTLEVGIFTALIASPCLLACPVGWLMERSKLDTREIQIKELKKKISNIDPNKPVETTYIDGGYAYRTKKISPQDYKQSLNKELQKLQNPAYVKSLEADTGITGVTGILALSSLIVMASAVALITAQMIKLNKRPAIAPHPASSLTP